MIDAIASSLTPEQASELVRAALASRLADSPVSALLGFAPTSTTPPPAQRLPTSKRPHSLVHPRREPDKDYLGGIVDVTVVSIDRIKANMARVILKDDRGRTYMWDATSAAGLGLRPRMRRRITATVLGKEGGHVKVHRVRFYGKSAQPPVRFTR